ncbi:MAG: 30S ribosomal protein S8 [bacterium]|nr:30S ribosomal protein S8 [bacterium]
MVTDPIADMLTRIRNAQAVGQKTVELPFSKFKFELAKTLKKEGFIQEALKRGKKSSRRSLEITLKYQEDAPQISEIKRISKPGRRFYVSCKDIKPVKQGFGIMIISTPKGLMTSREAKKQKLGGEVICEVW